MAASKACPLCSTARAVEQGILDLMRPGEASKRKCLASAGHSHVIQPTRGLGILAGSNAPPAAIQHHHMVKLQTLGAVGRQEQQATLPMACFPRPLREPLDEVLYRCVAQYWSLARTHQRLRVVARSTGWKGCSISQSLQVGAIH